MPQWVHRQGFGGPAVDALALLSTKVPRATGCELPEQRTVQHPNHPQAAAETCCSQMLTQRPVRGPQAFVVVIFLSLQGPVTLVIRLPGTATKYFNCYNRLPAGSPTCPPCINKINKRRARWKLNVTLPCIFYFLFSLSLEANTPFCFNLITFSHLLYCMLTPERKDARQRTPNMLQHQPVTSHGSYNYNRSGQEQREQRSNISAPSTLLKQCVVPFLQACFYTVNLRLCKRLEPSGAGPRSSCWWPP